MTTSRTPLYQEHLRLGARMVDFAGWEMPLQYSSVREEQAAVRTDTGVFDVSHMGRFSFSGRAVPEVLERILTNRISDLEPGRARYTLMCASDGGIIDDLVVYRDWEGDWHCVVNAANRISDLAWIRQHCILDAEVHDQSAQSALVAVQGPRAQSLLSSLGCDLASLPYFGVARANVVGVDMLVSRTGYTGEDGFELFAPAECSAGLWSGLVDAGAKPCGLAARDALRLEAGLRLYGADMDRSTNPLEVGLGWTVKLDQRDFVGHDALAAELARGPARRLVGLGGVERCIPRHGARIGRMAALGTVTSGTYSFWLGRGIGLGLVQAQVPLDAYLEVEVHNGWGAVEVLALPMYRGSAGRIATSDSESAPRP
ncbi:MAG TPA: glycine cleavage system aminomethyltransferase GcvT [Candidatus Nitrosotalea sp.]|nr:glycine cleavage system aminomethyltransferase GcvT [Candidatus Nitrosotalea sp.]